MSKKKSLYYEYVCGICERPFETYNKDAKDCIKLDCFEVGYGIQKAKAALAQTGPIIEIGLLYAKDGKEISYPGYKRFVATKSCFQRHGPFDSLVYNTIEFGFPTPTVDVGFIATIIMQSKSHTAFSNLTSLKEMRAGDAVLIGADNLSVERRILDRF